jgi:hypothetical protein
MLYNIQAAHEAGVKADPVYYQVMCVDDPIKASQFFFFSTGIFDSKDCRVDHALMNKSYPFFFFFCARVALLVNQTLIFLLTELVQPLRQTHKVRERLEHCQHYLISSNGYGVKKLDIQCFIFLKMF